mgnify:FL=1
MEVSRDFLVSIIGFKEVELVALRMRVTELEQKLAALPPAPKNNDDKADPA